MMQVTPTSRRRSTKSGHGSCTQFFAVPASTCASVRKVNEVAASMSAHVKSDV